MVTALGIGIPTGSHRPGSRQPGSRPVPISTYRIQLRNGITLDSLVDDGWLDHISRLGISHVYLSPILTSAPGSTHGYDVVDPTHVDPSIGGDEGFARLAAAAAERGLGLVVDLVPNHMSTDPVSNPYWWDVLRNGTLSVYWSYFDVERRQPEPRLSGRLLWPVLDDRYGRVLDEGRLTLGHRNGELVVRVDDRPLPVSGATGAPILALLAEGEDNDRLRLAADAMANLITLSPKQFGVHQRAIDDAVRDALAEPGVSRALDRILDHFNSDPDRLHEVLEQQNYRLAYWRSARDLGYRRFFDINDLVGLQMQSPEVFRWAHTAVGRWIDAGLIDGIRIDHPDGLADPAAYLQELQTMFPDGWLVVEKILEQGEQIPGEWPVDGSTGYEFAEMLGRWMIDPNGLHRLGLIRDDLVGEQEPIGGVIENCKRLVLDEMLSADLSRATDAFLRLCESLRRFRDVTRHVLHEIVREVVVSYPVYRTYVPAGTAASERDLGIISTVIGSVRSKRSDLDPELLDLFESILVGRLDDEVPAAPELRRNIEQLTGPVMAKGKEDTAFYRDVRLISRCEVGADPSASGLATNEFHDWLTRRAEHRPTAMTSLSTHDSKRSEDIRARLGVLSEVPAQWRSFAVSALEALGSWDPEGIVDSRTRYLLLQTIVGAYPIDGARLGTFAVKAVREAKVHTSWLDPDPVYEDAVDRLVNNMTGSDDFLNSVARFVDGHLLDPGRANSVIQKVVQLLGPGVPDLYWGSEDWYLRLVDPDNRQPPSLHRLSSELIGQLDSIAADGFADATSKLAAVAMALSLRRSHPRCVGVTGSYLPLSTSDVDDRVLAFARGDSLVVIAVRWSTRGALAATASVELPDGSWSIRIGEDVKSVPGGRCPLPELLGRSGLVVLERTDG